MGILGVWHVLIQLCEQRFQQDIYLSHISVLLIQIMLHSMSYEYVICHSVSSFFFFSSSVSLILHVSIFFITNTSTHFD